MLGILENERNVLDRTLSKDFGLLYAKEPDCSVDTLTKLRMDV